MKSATAAYWMPVTVSGIRYKHTRYEGFDGKTHDGIDKWFTKALDYFTDIYGTVVDAYYMVSEVRTNEQGNFDFLLSIVVTGLVDSEVDFEDNTLKCWPKDIVEQLKVTYDDFSFESVVGYDYNPILNNPEWKKYNY